MNYKQQYFKNHGLYECDVLFCKMCPQVAVNLHHVKYKSQGGTDDPDNLIPLCFDCHSGHHDKNKPTTKELQNANSTS